MKSKKSSEDIIIDSANYFIMVLVILVTLYPFYFILIQSFNEGLDSGMGGIYLWPRKFTLENYRTFFSKQEWIDSFLITVARTVIGSAVSVFFTCMVAYGLSYKNLIFKKLYFTVVIFTMYFSGGLIPYYILLRSIGLLDKFWVYIIPTMLNAFFLMIAVSFFREIPGEVVESAHLDGANDLIIFIRIIIPVSMPLIAAMLLFIGVNQWNSWIDSAYYVKSDELRTISYRMMEVINQSKFVVNAKAAEYAKRSSQTTPLSLQMAAMIIAIVPIACVYPFLQKYFIKGMMVGAVKG